MEELTFNILCTHRKKKLTLKTDRFPASAKKKRIEKEEKKWHEYERCVVHPTLSLTEVTFCVALLVYYLLTSTLSVLVVRYLPFIPPPPFKMERKSQTGLLMLDFFFFLCLSVCLFLSPHFFAGLAQEMKSAWHQNLHQNWQNVLGSER